MVYAYGIFICFIGSAMIILNERKSEENDNKNSFSLNFIFIGSIYLTINVTLFSLGLVGQKFLCKEKRGAHGPAKKRSFIPAHQAPERNHHRCSYRFSLILSIRSHGY